MVSDYFNNSSLTNLLGGTALKLNFIPGLNSTGTTASLASLVATGVNILYLVICVAVIVALLRSAFKRVRSEGEPKGIESATKSLRNVLWALISMFLLYIFVSFIWFFFTGASLFDAPNAFRYCGNTTIFDYSKAHPSDGFYTCVDGQFK